MSNQVVVVTGCSAGGIGYYLAQEFAARGCIVYATARKIEKMTGLTQGPPGMTIPASRLLSLDVTSDDDVAQVVKAIIDTEGRIDVVVNNAGIAPFGALTDVSLDQVKRTYETNVFSILRVVHAVLPHMAARRSGKIVNVGSIMGNIPTPWSGIYASTKAAIHSITETLYMECKPFNIDVVLVAPGSIQSNISTTKADDTFAVPEDSLYGAHAQRIMDRLYAIQKTREIPADALARRVVNAVLKRHPSFYISFGGNALLFALAVWLPRTWVLSLMWLMMGAIRT